MSTTNEVFNRLRPRFQIPKDVPIRKVDKREKCYTGESYEVSFYEVVFIAGLRLPFSYLYHQLQIIWVYLFVRYLPMLGESSYTPRCYRVS